METHKQEYKTDIARLAEQMASWKADMAQGDIERDAETHRRDKDNLRWQIGLWAAAIVILSFIVQL